MIRPSSLSLAEKCGLSAELAKTAPTSAAAQEGRDKNDELDDWLAGKAPKPKWFPWDNVRGRTQAPLALHDPETGEEITRGTADLVVVDGAMVTIVDWKTGSGRYVPPIAENLQLHAYGLALALSTEGATAYTIALAFTDRAEIQSATYGQDTWFAMLDRIKAVSSKAPEACVGPWCDGCFQRLRCPAHLLPGAVSEANTALAPLTSTDVVTADQVLRLHRAAKAMDELSEKGREYVKAWVRQHGSLPDGDQELALVEVAGRRSVSLKQAEAAGLKSMLETAGAISVSPPSERLTWRKRR